MYIEDRLFSEISEEVLYSVLMDEEEYDLFSELLYIQQREFNSKAAKLLREKALKRAAGNFKIPVYEAKGFKTAEIDPKIWKHNVRRELNRSSTRFNNKTRTYYNRNYDNFNPVDEFTSRIEYKATSGSASSRRLNRNKRLSKKYDLERYDHDVSNIGRNPDSRRWIVEDVRRSRLANS